MAGLEQTSGVQTSGLKPGLTAMRYYGLRQQDANNILLGLESAKSPEELAERNQIMNDYKVLQEVC